MKNSIFRIEWLTCIFLGICGVANHSWAATINASSCSLSAVQAAIDSASDGDTVTVPAGTCTWSSAAQIVNKTITFQGAGSDTGGTKIVYEGSGHTLIDVNAGNKTGKMDLSGFWLYGGASDAWNGAAVQLLGPDGWKNLRMHHMTFDSNKMYAVGAGANTHGVIDHCIFKGSGAHGIKFYGNGASDWSTPLTLGTADFFFVEDNQFYTDDWYGNIGDISIDMYNGGRVVFRYNDLKYGFIELHDKARSSLPSANAYEIYNNSFWSDTNKWKGMDITAGTGVIWGNTISGDYSFPIGAMDYKTADPRSLLPCDGNDPADQNTPGESGWRCQYQIGSQGEGPTAYGYPLYLWNNLYNGSPVGMRCSAGCSHLQSGRDFINNGSIPKPGYTP
jgi:hypothetical protein